MMPRVSWTMVGAGAPSSASLAVGALHFVNKPPVAPALRCTSMCRRWGQTCWRRSGRPTGSPAMLLAEAGRI
jgi:hypothetical protein